MSLDTIYQILAVMKSDLALLALLALADPIVSPGLVSFVFDNRSPIYSPPNSLHQNGTPTFLRTRLDLKPQWAKVTMR